MAHHNTGKGPKKRNPQTEQAILDGALRIFGEKGYEAATVSSIQEDSLACSSRWWVLASQSFSRL